MNKENRKTEKKDLLSEEIMEKVTGGDEGGDGGVELPDGLPPAFYHPYVCHRCGGKFFSIRDFGIHRQICQ